MWNFGFKSFLHDLKNHRDSPPVPRKGCDMPGCAEGGAFRAPKSRQDLRDYYWFCLEHVRAYNSNWDYFKGMSQGEIENQLHRNTVWDRPTWKTTPAGINEARLRGKVHARFAQEDVFASFSPGGEEEEEAQINIGSLPHPAVEALAALDLAPPVQWDEVRARYKSLAKKHHPDAGGDAEKFKKITLAYNILKLSWQHYLRLDGD